MRPCVDPARTHRGDHHRWSTARLCCKAAAAERTQSGAFTAHALSWDRRTRLGGHPMGRSNGRAPSLATSRAAPSSGCIPLCRTAPRAVQQGDQSAGHGESGTRQMEGGDGWVSAFRIRTRCLKQRAPQTRPGCIARPCVSPTTCGRTGLRTESSSQRTRWAREAAASAPEQLCVSIERSRTSPQYSVGGSAIRQLFRADASHCGRFYHCGDSVPTTLRPGTPPATPPLTSPIPTPPGATTGTIGTVTTSSHSGCGWRNRGSH